MPPPGGAERSRDRIYDAEEIRKLWAVFEGSTGTIYRLILTTGRRAGEVAGMTWSEIDFDSATWTVPAARMKSKQVHIVPLSELVLGILRKIPRLDDGFVLLSPKPGQKPSKLPDLPRKCRSCYSGTMFGRRLGSVHLPRHVENDYRDSHDQPT